MTSLSTALDGMSRAASSFDAAAARIARTGQSANNAPGAASTATPDGDTVNLSSSVVSLLEARNNFAANTKTFAVTDQMTKAALNMVG